MTILKYCISIFSWNPPNKYECIIGQWFLKKLHYRSISLFCCQLWDVLLEIEYWREKVSPRNFIDCFSFFMLYQEASCLSLGDRLVISEGWNVFLFLPAPPYLSFWQGQRSLSVLRSGHWLWEFQVSYQEQRLDPPSSSAQGWWPGQGTPPRGYECSIFPKHHMGIFLGPW